jgi:hypothetical protein
MHLPLHVFSVLNLGSIGSLDWQFSNITASSTYQFVGPWSELKDGDEPVDKNVFEMRGMHPIKLHWQLYTNCIVVTNWGIG